MPRDLDFDFQDENTGVRPRRPAPQREVAPGMGQGRPSPSARRKKNQTTSIIILAVEVVVFIALIILFFVLKGKIDNPSSSKSKTEQSAEGESSGGVNVESDDFSLMCTKVQLSADASGNPVALIYFTFANKTDAALAMSDVFPPSLTQNGMQCSTEVSLLEYPPELTNKDMQIEGGQVTECCFAFSIYDLESPLTLTIHDNYSTFSDIGSTQIPIS